VETLTGKVEITTQAMDAASACMETLNEWLWLLSGEEALSANSENMEPTWLMEDGQLPERLQQPARNMAIAARAIFKHLAALNDALTEARKEKGSDTTQIDKAAADIGFQWPCRATDGGVGSVRKRNRRKRAAHCQMDHPPHRGQGRLHLLRLASQCRCQPGGHPVAPRSRCSTDIGDSAFTGCI
jgi:hypothetical protein